MRLREPRYLLLRPCGGPVTVPHPAGRASEAAAPYLRDALPDEPGPAAETGAVSDHGAPHRSAAHGAETRRRDPVLQLGDQPSAR